jgi:hypothetical protein
MKFVLTIVLAVCLLAPGIAASATASSEERNLEQEATRLDKSSGGPQGEKMVSQRLQDEFKVTAAQVQALRDKKMGYGEIGIAYSLAKQMPGGITDANMNKIMTMRQGPPTMGWGNIAKELGTKLGPAVSQVKNVNRNVMRDQKQARNPDKKQDRPGGAGEQHREQMREQHKDMTREPMGGGKGR